MNVLYNANIITAFDEVFLFKLHASLTEFYEGNSELKRKNKKILSPSKEKEYHVSTNVSSYCAL